MNIDPSIGMTLHRENEQLRALLHELATFMRYDPPYGARRLRTWQAERDALVERAQWAAQPERKLSDVPRVLDELGGTTMSTPTYDLRYNPMHSFASSEEETVTAQSLGELIALIDEHVVEDDYCWISLHEDGVETGRGQYYHVVETGKVVDAIEEHGTAQGLRERINAVEQDALDRMR